MEMKDTIKMGASVKALATYEQSGTERPALGFEKNPTAAPDLLWTKSMPLVAQTGWCRAIPLMVCSMGMWTSSAGKRREIIRCAGSMDGRQQNGGACQKRMERCDRQYQSPNRAQNAGGRTCTGPAVLNFTLTIDSCSFDFGDLLGEHMRANLPARVL
jgi:hypothetical protein